MATKAVQKGCKLLYHSCSCHGKLSDIRSVERYSFQRWPIWSLYLNYADCGQSYDWHGVAFIKDWLRNTMIEIRTGFV
jgi:hypothetical protein